MSVLIVALEPELARTLTRRLVGQGDEVRVIAQDHEAEAQRNLGAHVARGAHLDADLVERAAQNVRSIVVGPVEAEVMSEILAGARLAHVERIIVGTPRPLGRALDLLRDAPIQYVVLDYRKKRAFSRRSWHSDELVALLIDAADDLAGEPRLELDLDASSTFETLGIETRRVSGGGSGQGSGTPDR